ncbi:MAG: indolepyruvate oxidoreductase subunit beta [Methanomicrobiales archaeon]|nr:indolepyruvate oxidoreductase subunit beta [Methanomicrobiales archaeon]
MNESYDILIVGVGGQGTILASNVLGEACLIEGRHVMSAETHGMAQRGGSVESHVRIDGVFGPLIAPGTADCIIAFDMLEALRYRHFLKEDGMMVVNSAVIIPTSAFQRDLPVPSHDEILARLGTPAPCVIDAAGIAIEAGSILAQNIVMLGAASHFMPLSPDSLTSAVERLVPPKTVEINVRAFGMGREAAEACRT